MIVTIIAVLGALLQVLGHAKLSCNVDIIPLHPRTGLFVPTEF